VTDVKFRRVLIGLVLLSLSLAACASAGMDFKAISVAPLPDFGDAATNQRMKVGHDLFSSRCQRCHALPDPSGLLPDAWPGEVASMSRKSGLLPDQTAQVSDYLVAVSRLSQPAAPVAKTN
jgi:hypothetical protein